MLQKLLQLAIRKLILTQIRFIVLKVGILYLLKDNLWTLGCCVHNTIFCVTDEWAQKARVFIPYKHSKSTVI
jgi:hypothetical protein